jgi:hypothetical protein
VGPGGPDDTVQKPLGRLVDAMKIRVHSANHNEPYI